MRQSRLTVEGDTSRTCAASSIVSPPNARSSTILARAASTSSRRSERLIQREDGDAVWRGGVFGFVDGHTAYAVATLDRVVTASVVNQDPAHDLCRDAEEVRSILPVDMALVDEPEVDLVNERRRLQGVVRPLASKLPRGRAPKLCIHERQQLIERSPIAATPIAE